MQSKVGAWFAHARKLECGRMFAGVDKPRPYTYRLAKI